MNTITITTDEESITVNGRVAVMVRWLTTQAERLNGQERLKVEFHCAGRQVKPSVTFFGDAEPIVIE